MTTLQQRLVDAQQSIERDYWQRRKLRTRQRLLSDKASAPRLLLDAVTLAVIDAYPAAAKLFHRGVEGMIGMSLFAALEGSSHAALIQLLDSARFAERSPRQRVRLIGGEQDHNVTIEACEADAGSVLLPRITSLGGAVASGVGPIVRINSLFAGLVEYTSDAIVIGATTGRIIYANKAFRDLVHADAAESLDGTALSDWLQTSHISLAGLVTTICANGSPGLLRARLLRCADAPLDVELSVTLIDDASAIGFTIRVAHESQATGMTGSSSCERNVH
ncbi:MAG: PAS domain-containing protein [Dokdonella sp.]